MAFYVHNYYVAPCKTLGYSCVTLTFSDVCFLRLDFEAFNLLGPTLTDETNGGACALDTFKVTVRIVRISSFESIRQLNRDLVGNVFYYGQPKVSPK